MENKKSDGRAAVRNAASKGRTPMSIELRAKQFMPFAAVTGLEEALREKERARELNEKEETE